jgi:cystathionine beta-lyase
MSDISAIENAITDNTKMLWIETPTNPLLNIIDIEEACLIAKRKGITTVVDNTFATPFSQNPLDLGADIVMHSVTKYLSGHSDVLMGAILVNDEKLLKDLSFIQNSCGAVPGPQDCFLVLRGLKTLHIRMQRHSENGKAVANFLNAHPSVDDVYWPGNPNHTNHEIAKKQMRYFGGMISFTLKDDNIQSAFEVLKKLKLFTLAESLGGVESLSGHPASMTHASIPKEEREKTGLKDTLIRLSVGIEDIDDLIEDLKQALP